VEIKLINTQKVLSPTQITLADYVINPFRGCEFGCLYCYSQENKNIEKKDFFTSLGVKINAPEVLEKELKYKKPKRVLLGSTTECFQYQELKHRLTEKILGLLNNHNIPYTILTKSNLIADYLPLISANKANKIYFTLNVASDSLIQAFEEKSPSLKQRIQAIKKIISFGVPLRIHAGPFIPYISSLTEIIDILPKGVKEIDVELYHYKIGNFKAMLNVIEKNLGRESKNKVSAVYENKASYQRFTKELKAEINKFKSTTDTAFYYIVPDFNAFYNSTINYRDSL
jgi:DNA repair photolyase